MSKDRKEAQDELLKIVTVVESPENYDIRVSLGRWAKGPVTIRLNRVGEKKDGPFVGALGSVKSAAEARALAAALEQAADALEKL